MPDVTVAQFARARQEMTDHAVLVVHGRDGTGIVAAITAVLGRHDATIVSLEQHSDNPPGGSGTFFQRTAFSRPPVVSGENVCMCRTS